MSLVSDCPFRQQTHTLLLTALLFVLGLFSYLQGKELTNDPVGSIPTAGPEEIWNRNKSIAQGTGARTTEGPPSQRNRGSEQTSGDEIGIVIGSTIPSRPGQSTELKRTNPRSRGRGKTSVSPALRYEPHILDPCVRTFGLGSFGNKSALGRKAGCVGVKQGFIL